jgi:hypothetical protein
MKIETRSDYGGAEAFDSDLILPIGSEYIKQAFVRNCTGAVSIAPSEAEAKRLAEVAHAGKGWTWGILLIKKPPKEQGNAQVNSPNGVHLTPSVGADLNR